MHVESVSKFNLLIADVLDELWNLFERDAPDADAAQGVDEPQANLQRLPRYLELIKQIEGAAMQSGLAGLQAVCAMYAVNLQALYEAGSAPSSEQQQLLQAWPALLMAYVISQGDTQSIDALLKSLGEAAWPLAMSDDDQCVLKEMFVSAAGESSQVNSTRASLTHDASFTLDVTDLVVDGVSADLPATPNNEQQKIAIDMLEMLSTEFAQMIPQMEEDLATVVSKHLSDEEKKSAFENYDELIERLSKASESVGLMALSQLFIRLRKMLSASTIAVSSSQQSLLEKIPGLIAEYFICPGDDKNCAAMINLLSDDAWLTPISANETPQWVNALGNVVLHEGSENVQTRQSQATVGDVTLALPDDINDELLDGLLQELPIQTSAFTSAIERIVAGIGNLSDINRAMRAAHTLKGAANTVGIRGIANLTHHLEDILEALTDENRLPGPDLAAMLVDAGDCLEAMSESLLGVGPAPDQALEVMQAVLDYANLIDRDGVTQIGQISVPTLAKDLSPNNAIQNKEPIHESLSLPGQGTRITVPVVDELLRLAGETLIFNSQIQDGLRRTVSHAEAIKRQQQLVTQLVAELENLVDIRGIAAPSHQGANTDQFDALEFENFSELHTVTKRLIEATSDSQQLLNQVSEQYTTLGDLLDVQQRLQMENQHAVISTRLVPVSSIASRLHRSVRQTCRLLDKKVELVISGETTHIDSTVLSDLMDPLMHILRNAVDHGIDEPAARVASGKPSTGRIELSFSREGNTIVVRCKDDGVGLDYAAIHRIAERKGMLPAEHNPSQEELARMILVNGFSTREETTQVSGRGVGMDVVYSNVLQMKGTLALNSESGQGLLVELRLPATLLSTHSLIVRQGEKLLAISSRGVEDIHYVTQEEIVRIELQPFYRVGDEVHNIVKLETLLGLPGDKRETGRLGFPVLLTRMENGTLSALLVQEVIDGREVVVKDFGRYVPKIHGSIGATILGDGSVAPVIDLVELLRMPVLNRVSSQSGSVLRMSEPENKSSDLPIALVVDDSLTARRTAATIMKDAGYAVRTAIDGLEAVTMLKHFIPDIMLVDMEMPRMNGLELTSHLRNEERTKHIPIIMITSRSTEKHRRQGKAAGADVYLIKPFSEEELLDQVLVLAGRQ